MAVYNFLGRLPWPRGFAARLLTICFFCTHIPLILLVFGLAAWVGFDDRSAQVAVGLTLIGTLGGTALVLYVVRAALVPIDRTREALDGFFSAREMPTLPTDYEDEIGRLMAHTQAAIEGLAGTLTDLDALAHADPLTGIGNRRWLLREADTRLTTPLGASSLILFSLDGFKEINEQHGHFAGDNALRDVARYIAFTVGPDGCTARFGGAEFCVLLPKLGLQEAAEVAERLRTSVVGRGFGGLQPGVITASLGVARVTDRLLTESLRRVDLLASKARDDGGNRVVVETIPDRSEPQRRGAR